MYECVSACKCEKSPHPIEMSIKLTLYLLSAYAAPVAASATSTNAIMSAIGEDGQEMQLPLLR